MRKINRVLLLLSFVCIYFSLGTEEAFANSEENMRIIIKYKENRKLSYTQNEKLEIKNIQKKDFEKIKKQLERNTAIDYMEEDSKYYYAVNDPLINNQANYFEILSVENAWLNNNQNSTPTVAILDSGIDHMHPDLKGRIVKPFNVLSPGSMPTDEIGHGTHVSGLVGASTNNGIGIASIAREVNIMPIKVGDKDGAFASDIAKGIDFAVNNGADIINISIAGPNKSTLVQTAIANAISKDVLVVAAAGNSASPEVQFPAGYSDVLSVGAVNGHDMASFSNYGEWVSVAAPGVNIFSTHLTTFAEGYKYMDGTSMASPIIASQAAFLKSIDYGLSSAQLSHIIEESSVHMDHLPVKHGIANVEEAVQYYHQKNRISGKNSLETSVAIALNGWTTLEEKTLSNGIRNIKGKFALLASNQNFADSLATVPLAYKLDSPIFLTENNYLPQSSIITMKEMGVNHVIVVGGEQAISKEVEKKLITNGLITERISGKTRYDTAVEINKFLSTTSEDVIVVNGKSFPDALSISAHAATKGIPILFVEKTWVPDATKQFIQDNDFKNRYIIGGTAVVSTALEASLDAKRISGANRYATNIEVLSSFPCHCEGYNFATGKDFKDALSGGLLSAKQNKALLLVRPDDVDAATEKYLLIHPKKSFNIFGGRKAVDSSVIWEIDRLLSGY
ncbi:cell wall-associated protease [Bacillus tianshenii]|uniref:Cell wall-associated protease n=1 Tax=Sutcliffiella tianshenii TaxID=1463404 RepID=A0ABS2NUS9_9BACI|nr:cell wall-binding repeat-containing protein [Bacillus tianshenii]MBM7618384.1 cell wall-associated protease [Bacillus tianshenii]